MILALELCLPKATRGRIFTRTSKHLGNLEHFRQKHLGNLEHFEFLCIFALKIKQL